MRDVITGKQLHRETIIIEQKDRYEVFKQVYKEAWGSVKRVKFESYIHDDFYVVCLTYPCGSKGYIRMMRGLHDHGYNLEQLTKVGGLNRMIVFQTI